MTKRSDQVGSPEEERFFDLEPGAPVPDDYVDPELEMIVTPPSMLQPILLVLIILFAGYLLSEFWSEARYALSSDEPVVIGDVVRLQPGDDGHYQLPDNRYATLSGITQRRAAVAGRGYAKLAGAPIIAEVSREAIADAPTDITFGELVERGGDRYVVSEPGRLVAFSTLPRRYRSILRYLATGFEERYCGVDLAPDLDRAIRVSRQEAIASLQQTRDEPLTEAQITAELGPECKEAWLYQEGAEPQSFRRYVVYVAVFSAAILASLLGLVFWVRRFRRSTQ